MKLFHIFIFFRFLIAGVFMVSGAEKIISPVQNFMYVIESYDFLPDQFIRITAHVMPWMELGVGVFLFLGLWLRPVLWAAAAFFVSFQGVLGQAMIRKLPIDSCGCFGESFSVPMPVMFMLDTAMLALTLILIWKIHLTARCSLDNYFKSS